MVRTAVVIPTYRRPDDLQRCARAVLSQVQIPDELVIVHHETDDQSRVAALALVNAAGPQIVPQIVTSSTPGVLAAMTAGVRATSADIIAFIDDDAVPAVNWLSQLVQTLEQHPRVGGVGGRDDIPGLSGTHTESTVGMITWYGRIIGNHHLGRGDARHVHVLKGVNMAFRRTALALPANLRGSGAEVHYEIATSRWAATLGYSLIYDPHISVDHHLSARSSGANRTDPLPEDVRNAAFNLVFTLVGMGSSSFWPRAAYGIVAGDRGAPGFLRAIYALLRGDRETSRRLKPSLLGQLDALSALRRGERPKMITF